MQRSQQLAIDLAIGALIPYTALACFLAVFKSGFEPAQIAFSFILPILLLFFPFATLPYNPLGAVVLLAIAGAFYAVFRYVRPAFRRYVLAAIFVGWGFYGFYCAHWIAA